MKLSSLIKSTLVSTALLASSFAFAANIEVNANDNDLAIKGYDTVSYFTEGTPTKGSDKYTAAYNGAIYHFASADNRDLFKEDPTKYAPQYGGFCAFGVALNQKFDTDPTAWHIKGDKLYLNLNKDVQKKWLTDVPGYLAQSQGNWTTIKGLTTEQIEEIND
ncbi:YHS domain-containing (seleno)protein [uncultured Psychromonas sp.]|uniref:YHS domain-containing (seleno)protein n=1 Tax=uncultured Psychromonas sp. TaxID=173974 RepID=UPI00261F2E8A|nr:YHS domain-containing (seleno)protein [uncultured Psychromonas sp.]